LSRSILICVTALATICVTESRAVPAGVPGDYSNDGFVTHADYSVLGDSYGQNGLPNRNSQSGGNVGAADFEFYKAQYGGQSSPSPSSLEFVLTPWQTPGGDVAWTFAFKQKPDDAYSALAGHFGIEVVGHSGAPNIYNILPGEFATDDGVGSAGVPGSNPFAFDFLTPTDTYGHPNGKYSEAADGSTSHAYVAFGTKLGHTFGPSETVPLFTIFTGSVRTTTLRILGGAGKSEFGYGGRDWYLPQTIEATFAWQGDFNGDLVVDVADYTVWRNNLGTNFALGGNGDEEGDSAGVVDLADYAIWKSRFGAILFPCGPGGQCVGSGGIADGYPTSTGLPIQVPEPSTIGLMLAGAMVLALRVGGCHR